MIKRFLLIFMLFLSFLSQKALAISITLDGTQQLISGHECQIAKYRFGTQSSYQGQPIDLILEVTNEDNDYSSDKCVDIVNNVISFRLRDKDYYNNYAYMDVKITVVKKGTLTPLAVDTITVTNFDLDNNPYYTGTDDVYYQSPTKVYLSEYSNVTKSIGSFFSRYTTKLKGQSSGNCDDSATLLQKECRGGVSFNNTSTFYARVQNDNAYGTISTSYDSYRLIQFSFELKDLTPLMSNIELPCGTYSYSTSQNAWIDGENHNGYNNNVNFSKTVKIKNSKELKVTINGETEKNFDWFYIYDENGNEIYVDSGSINKTLTINGSEITIKMTSDSSITKSGLSVKIEGIGCQEEPTVSIANSVEITEGDSGDKDLLFTIQLDNPAPSGGVSVGIQPHNITANEGEDYARVTSSLHFNQGEQQKTIIYKIHGDTKVEDNETFSIELHNPQHAKLDENHKTAIGTIINDDKDIFVSIKQDESIKEGDSGTKLLNFTILLSDPAPVGGVNVQVQPHNIIANEGEDYSRNSSSIYFAPGEKEKIISYTIKGDTKVEDNETFSIEIHNPQHAKIDENHKTAIGTIINDDSSKPIGCLQTAWMFQNKPTDISALNLANGQMSLVKNNITSDNINALGFNKKDGYFWGYSHTKRDGTIVRIGMNDQGDWIAEYFKVSGLNGFDSYVGDIDNSGHLYLKGSGSSKRVVVIDLNPKSSNYLKKIKDFNLNFNLNTADWGFNPKDNLLYAVNNGSANKYLYKIDPSNGHLISKKNTLLTGRRGFGASFFDANGFYYVYDNRSGNIYRIDVANSSTAVLFAHANIVSLNDGAMCTDAELKFDFGDLPEEYPTKLESNGARHSLPTYGEPTVYLGDGVSNENNGKPSNSANLDEKDDGVKLNGNSLQGANIDAGKSYTLKIKTHGRGYLSGWIDWNSDGDFNDANEQIAKNIDGSGGVITLNIVSPSSAIDIDTYARFRYSYQRDLTPTGSAIDGEVEDYKINIHGNLEPFSCSDKLYLSNRTELGVGSGDSGATWLHSFYAMTPAFVPIGDGFTSSNGGYNAIGYNPQDNFIYALYGNRLLKIDKNANVKDLGVVDGLPEEQLYAGAFDREGYYFVSGNGGADDRLYKIDISQKKVIQTLSLRYSMRGKNEAVKFWDMAIDTTDQYFYAMLVKDGGDDFVNDKFVKIDKNTGIMSVIGDNYSDINSYISLIFTDKNGKIVTIANNKGMYEIDPSSGTAYWINATPELSYYNDGTNCPDASFVLPPHIPRLSIGDVSKAEGDSGETNFEFKVSIDADLPMVPMGMPVMFLYKIIDGNGNDITPPHEPATQGDHDFRGGDGIGIDMRVFSKNRETTINVPVYGDTKVEADEEFFVDIYFPQMFPQNFCMLGKSRGVGLILNDDIKFKVVRTNGDKDDDSLYTQIAGRDFDYSIISDTNNNIEDMTLKIELIDNNTSTTLYRGYRYIQNSSRVDITDDNDLAILNATKDASFKISFLKDENGTIVHGDYANEESYNSIKNRAGYSEMSQDDVGDHFAIRPAGYIVEIRDIDENNESVTYRDSNYNGDEPLNLSTGYRYQVYAKAIAYDRNSSTTLHYTNDINATLDFNDKSSCNDTSDIKIDNYRFNNGVLQDYISHENVGKYILKMSDDSWSDIDKNSGGCIANSSAISQNGNEKSGCNISTDAIENYHEIEMKFYPYSFAIDAKVQNIPNSTKDFIYMSDLAQSLDMALDIKADIVAQSKNHTPLTNFTYSCAANDIVLSLDYSITTDRIDNQPTYDKIVTKKGSEVTFKGVVAFNDTTPNIDDVQTTHLDNNITITADKFLNINEGNSTIDILYNLTKNLSEPTNPVALRFNRVEINSTKAVAKIKNKTVKADGIGDIGTTKKLYFSSVAPDRENYPEEYDRYCVTPISVLIYCDQNTTWCTDMIEDNGLNNQKTKIGWYTSILHDSNIDGKVLGFTVDNLLGVVTPTADRLPNFNEDRAGKILKLTTGYSGHTFPTKVQVDMELSPWLKYHREANRDGVPFWRVTFRDRNETFSGYGNTGNQVDIKTTTREAKKISW